MERHLRQEMKMDYLQRLYGDWEDPSRSGDMKSWFFFYKWQVEGEVHFDLTEEDKTQYFSNIGPGDRLWFSMDGLVVGYVDVLRVEEDPTRDVWEIWYDGSLCHKYTEHGEDPKVDRVGTPDNPALRTVVPLEVATKWMEHCDVHQAEA